jgi:hypothetical protein
VFAPIWTVVLASVLLFAGAGLVLAQAPSTDRDNPTQLTANVITGDGVDEKTQYFYSFTAGPGEITVTLDVKADKSAAVSSVDLALFNSSSKKLLSTYSNPDHGSTKRAVETASIHGTQPLLLEVDVSTGISSFKIKIDGAVALKPGTGPGNDAGGSTEPAAPAALAAGNSSDVVPISISTDENKPTSLENHIINGASVSEPTKYFCTFEAGPGKVTLKLDVRAMTQAAHSHVNVELRDSDAKPLISGSADPGFGQTKQELLTVNLAGKQKLWLKITVSTGVDNYMISLGGAISIVEAAELRQLIYSPPNLVSIDRTSHYLPSTGNRFSAR